MSNGTVFYGDTVLSSRVRLARNVDGVPFPVRLNIPERRAVTEKACRALSEAGLVYTAIDMRDLYPYEAVSLAERHLISPEFASVPDGRVLILAEQNLVSIMLNEEDHVRVQAFAKGLDPENAYALALKYDDALDAGLHFAFDNSLGYLNQNPHDLGTGMRVSVMMHLPALSRTGAMEGISSAVTKLGLSIRGAYGEGSSVKGDIYRIGNRLSLGIDEKTAINNLRVFAMQLATKERTAAEEFVKDLSVRDRVRRAEGLLENAVLLSADEMTEMLSWIRLGAVRGLCDKPTEVIDELFVSMQPATVNVLAGGKLSAAERDEVRAAAVRKRLFSE